MTRATKMQTTICTKSFVWHIGGFPWFSSFYLEFYYF